MLLHTVSTSQHNLPFQKHEEDLRVWADVFHCWRARANLTSHDIAEQMNHIFLSLYRKVQKHFLHKHNLKHLWQNKSLMYPTSKSILCKLLMRLISRSVLYSSWASCATASVWGSLSPVPERTSFSEARFLDTSSATLLGIESCYRFVKVWSQFQNNRQAYLTFSHFLSAASSLSMCAILSFKFLTISPGLFWDFPNGKGMAEVDLKRNVWWNKALLRGNLTSCKHLYQVNCNKIKQKYLTWTEQGYR